MKKYKIYTCGKMSGTTYTQQMAWREKLERYLFDTGCENFTFVHPPMYFNYDEQLHQSEREILDWEMAQLYDSDIVVVNLEGICDSVGSHMELGALQAINRFCGKKSIFVVGLGNSENLHPWIKESCLRIEKNIEDLGYYIKEYLMV